MGSFKKADARSSKSLEFTLCDKCSAKVDEIMGTELVENTAPALIPTELVDFKAIMAACPTCTAALARRWKG